MGRGDTFGLYVYKDDQDNEWTVKLTEDVAAQGGFAAAAVLGNPWPFNTKNLRHVTGRTATGKTGRLPIGDRTNAKYDSGGDWTLGGDTYSISGRFGERKPFSAIGG